MAQMDGAVSYCFWEICSKNTGLQGSKIVCVPGKIEKAVFTSVQVL